MLIDTAGCGMEEAADEDSDSKRNEGEAKVNTARFPKPVSGMLKPHLTHHARLHVGWCRCACLEEEVIGESGYSQNC